MHLIEFSEYHIGDVLNLHWNRGNGELDRNYVLCGFNYNGLPLLVYASAISDENPVFFDIADMEKYIEKIEQADKKPIDSKIISKILEHSKAN